MEKNLIFNPSILGLSLKYKLELLNQYIPLKRCSLTQNILFLMHIPDLKGLNTENFSQ